MPIVYIMTKMPSYTLNAAVEEKRSGSDRRDGKLLAFSKYWLTGKRAVLRRKEDRENPGWIDRHSPKTLAAILIIISLSIMDAMFTLILVSHGAVELNPFMAYYLNHSPLLFFSIKYLMTCAAILLVLFTKNTRLFRTRLRVKTLFIFFIIPFALVVQWEIFLILFCI